MSTILAPAAFHHAQSTGVLDYVLHLVIGSAVWHVVARLPVPLQLALAGVAVVLVMWRRRRRRYA